METTMFCDQCGCKFKPSANFCHGCGSRITKSSLAGFGRSEKTAMQANSTNPTTSSLEHMDTASTEHISADHTIQSSPQIDQQFSNKTPFKENSVGGVSQALPTRDVDQTVTYHLTKKQIGILVSVIGGFLLLIGLVRLNSLESQFVRGIGGSDNLSNVLVVLGVLATIGGIFAIISPPFSAFQKELITDALISKCPNCGAYNHPGAAFCKKCEHALNKAAASVPLRNPTSPPPLSPQEEVIERLERLLSLRERGALSDEEFQQEKSKLIR